VIARGKAAPKRTPPKIARISKIKRTAAALTAIGALGALALSGCSSGPSQPNADLPKSSPAAHVSKAPSPSPSTSSTVPTFDIPSDLHVVIDADTTSNATENTVLTDAGYQWMSYMEAISEGNAGDPNFQNRTIESAYATMSQTVSSWKSRGQRLAGTDHIFNRTVTLNSSNTLAVYDACENASQTVPLTVSDNASGTNTSGSGNYVLWQETFQNIASAGWILVDIADVSGASQCSGS
jgi:hypothetical protein